jgi:hypothetical protein
MLGSTFLLQQTFYHTVNLVLVMYSIIQLGHITENATYLLLQFEFINNLLPGIGMYVCVYICVCMYIHVYMCIYRFLKAGCL